jgi:arylsulfatase A-like enzyme
MMKRTAWIVLLTALVWAAGCGGEPGSDRPNVIYIMTDDHAAHMLSAYGSQIASTPNLDRIGTEGVRFANAFVTNALCAPARAVLLTGKYSHKNGKLDNATEFDGSQQTFPKLLQAAGYQTAMIGKWHLKSEPTGFDYWNVLPGQGKYHNPELIEMGERKTHEGYVTDIITDFALDWLKGRDRTKPFVLLYHHKAPHGPWESDEKHVSMFAGEVAKPDTFDDDLKGRAPQVQAVNSMMVPTMRDRFIRWQSPTKPVPDEGLPLQEQRESVYQSYVKDYMRVVASVDDNVGRLLDYLDEEGLAENTVVIYTTDNGMFVGDHGLFDKRLMHEESLRIPLLVRYPKEIAAGSVSEGFALNVDYAATILDFAGVEVPADMQGKSLRPLFRGEEPADWRQSIYYHYYEHPSGHNVAKHYGVRTERYKLIHYYEDDVWELIDMQEDEHEYRNVYGQNGYEEATAELKAELVRLRAELDVVD